jgi:hypothetical protein
MARSGISIPARHAGIATSWAAKDVPDPGLQDTPETNPMLLFPSSSPRA